MGCEGTMDIDLVTEEVGPTEETVEALMEYLVGPLLPLKHGDIAKETPSESQQTMVAKQVHAAAVLYNYYHINHHREQEFLMFDQFCNLAIMFKPSILQHMKYMCQSDHPTINDPANQLSLTEKAIMDACTISETLLGASPNVSSTVKEWPITKVAVLLIDSKKENCLLQFNNGVWSVIEKDLCSEETGIASESKTGKKRRMTLTGKHDADKEAGFQKLAFSAVKEVAGIPNAELKILEDHVVYSLSRAKTATRFYIVQSTQSISEDILVPIQDAISSLQGPVVKKSSGSWAITPVVEYYYLLPYAEIISEWFSRVSNKLPHHVREGSEDANILLGSQKSCEKEIGETKRVSSDNLHINSKSESKSEYINNSSKEEPGDSIHTKNRYTPNKQGTTLEPVSKMPEVIVTSPMIGSPCDKEIIEMKSSICKEIVGANSDSMKEKEVNGSCIVGSNNSSSGANNKGIDKPLVCLQEENQVSKTHAPLKVYHHGRRRNPTNATVIKKELTDVKNIPSISECKDERVDCEKKSCIVSSNEDRTLTVDHALASSQQNNKSLENFHSTLAAKGSELSEAALQALLKKREKLRTQQRTIEDELALCDKNIEAILRGGIGDCLDLKLETVIDCCNEIWRQDDMQVQETTDQPLLGKSLSEAQLTLRKSCQELDDICLANNWRLPIYQISHSNGGFLANVSVKGSDFECSYVSGVEASIHEARNSAATQMIAKLQQMASEHATMALL